MTEIIEFGGGEFELMAKNMPKDAKHMHMLEGSKKLVVVMYGDSVLGGNYIKTAWLGNKELGLSFDDRDELEAMLGFAQDNARQDIAEGGA